MNPQQLREYLRKQVEERERERDQALYKKYVDAARKQAREDKKCAQ